MEENIRQLEKSLTDERRKIEEYRKRKEEKEQQERMLEEMREKFNFEDVEIDLSFVLQSIMAYLVHLERKIDANTVSLHIVTRLVKGKDKVNFEEETKGEDRKPPQEKLMKDAIRTVEKPGPSKKESEKPAKKKQEPTEKKEESAKESEKPKRKEKVKMKLPFTYSNKEENLLLWIAEIQTYCGTAPIEPESQVAFSTSCLGRVAKEWVLAEANAAGFEDIGEWAKTLTLRQFLQDIKERFLDKTTTDIKDRFLVKMRTDKDFDELTTIGQKRWSSVDSLSREVDRLLQVLGLNLQEKLMKDAIRMVEKPGPSKKESEKQAKKKQEPTEKKEESAKESEKSKKKEKVKMKLPFTHSNKEENLLLWIAEIQTYCGTTPVEPQSQVAFSTSCLGGVAKEWVLAEANVAGFEDIGEWAKTLALRQFLQKIKERFLDKTTTDIKDRFLVKTRTDKAFDEFTTIGQKRWSSVDSLLREVDCLLQVLGLNLQDNQVLYIYSRALPEPIRG
ncbi:hypothetical protein CBR_g38883 [Chara braunii]|uniref:Retrotransposon gag domain-containing protein n=1 Tax=Chara braunii TaxID=69332 RepID=A0A388LQI1_CHABU|nr:hypothetical protein CBR_g38883 [Chara braunii]|eukprot:GBG84600.1 hypothetical protein CBR_g38883 [Chara braunii]